MIFKTQHDKLVAALDELRRKDEIVSTWEARRALVGKAASHFCGDHDIYPTDYSKWTGGQQVPGNESVLTVESAFTAEGWPLSRFQSHVEKPVQESGAVP